MYWVQDVRDCLPAQDFCNGSEEGSDYRQKSLYGMRGMHEKLS